jgi:hypothetical protein
MFAFNYDEGKVALPSKERRHCLRERAVIYNIGDEYCSLWKHSLKVPCLKEGNVFRSF